MKNIAMLFAMFSISQSVGAISAVVLFLEPNDYSTFLLLACYSFIYY